MIKINKDTDLYNAIANVIATVIGLAGASIISGFCNSMISVSECGPVKKSFMNLGKMGLETVTTFEVSAAMRDDIDDIVDFYNDMVGASEEYKRKKLENNGIVYDKESN